MGGVAASVTWTSADAGGGAFSGIVAVLFAGLASSALATLADTHRPTTDASTRVRMRTCPAAPGATTRSARTHDTSWPSAVHVHPASALSKTDSAGIENVTVMGPLTSAAATFVNAATKSRAAPTAAGLPSDVSASWRSAASPVIVTVARSLRRFGST